MQTGTDSSRISTKLQISSPPSKPPSWVLLKLGKPTLAVFTVPTQYVCLASRSEAKIGLTKNYQKTDNILYHKYPQITFLPHLPQDFFQLLHLLCQYMLENMMYSCSCYHTYTIFLIHALWVCQAYIASMMSVLYGLVY